MFNGHNVTSLSDEFIPLVDQNNLSICFLPGAWRAVRVLYYESLKSGTEMGGFLVGFFMNSLRSSLITHVLFGNKQKRSPSLLDLRPDEEHVSGVFEKLDAIMSYNLYFLGNIHSHLFKLSSPSGIDMKSNLEYCSANEISSMICPIIGCQPGFKIHGWQYSLGQDAKRCAVRIMSHAELFDRYAASHASFPGFLSRLLLISEYKSFMNTHSLHSPGSIIDVLS